MRKSKENNQNNTTTTIAPSTSNKTPIEIALQIDKDGMTTASKLYTFLELDITHFSRWCRKNIVNNKFATENEDYVILAINGDNSSKGRPKTDYKLTSEFAKKLSMTGNTEKHEQARDYFIACEQGLKVATAKLEARNADIKSLTNSINNLVQKIDDKFSLLDSRVTALENNITPQKALPKRRYTYWQSKMFPKYQALAEYFDIQFKDLYKNIYREFQNMYPEIELNQIVDDYCYENKPETCYTLDAIEHDKTVRPLFEQLVDNLLEKYDLALHKENVVVATIFDTDAK
nr:antA/AntB antirepressor family protein [uncultured Lachnoclostridium sp.]